MTGTNGIKIFISGAALVVGMAYAGMPEYNPERYDVILDRSPFGADPLLGGGGAQQNAASAVAAAARELRLCFLLESESGEIRAGFQNLKAKPGDPKSVVLMVGESFMGMKLLAINLPGSQATMESRGEPVVFELSKAPTSARAALAKSRTPSPSQPQRKFGGGFRRRTPPPQKPVPPPEPKLSTEEQERRRAEVRANLQDYQMEVIRSGMPPLPIPLTQEMDDQLVAEGVLPPAEGQ